LQVDGKFTAVSDAVKMPAVNLFDDRRTSNGLLQLKNKPSDIGWAATWSRACRGESAVSAHRSTVNLSLARVIARLGFYDRCADIIIVYWSVA
jgi:hypothetical protein